MKILPSFLLFCIFVFLSNSIYSQISPKEPTIQLKATTFYLTEDKSGHITVSQYLVNGKPLKLTEVYFARIEDVKPTIEAKVKKLGNCHEQKTLFYEEKLAGHSFLCSKETDKVLIYDFGEKYYEVSSESEKTINNFTNFVAPLVCHLYDSSKCISKYY
jgi:hypothetical protein